MYADDFDPWDREPDPDAEEAAEERRLARRVRRLEEVAAHGPAEQAADAWCGLDDARDALRRVRGEGDE